MDLSTDLSINAQPPAALRAFPANRTRWHADQPLTRLVYAMIKTNTLNGDF